MKRRLQERNRLGRSFQDQQALAELVVDSSVPERRRVDRRTKLVYSCLVVVRPREKRSAHEVMKQRITWEKTSLSHELYRVDETARAKGVSSLDGRAGGEREHPRG